MIYLQFRDDSSGVGVYGYGQTIYAKIHLRFELIGDNELRLEYLPSPPGHKLARFEPMLSDAGKCLKFRLYNISDVFRESVTGTSFRFTWRLDLSGSPFPDSLGFPYEFPNEFFGYRENLGKL